MSLLFFAIAAAMVGAPLQDAPDSQLSSVPAITTSPVPAVVDADLVIGAAEAPVTIVVYTSLVCPQCAAWHRDIFPEVVLSHVEPGAARIVLRQTPTNPSEVSFVAAGIVRCAAPAQTMATLNAMFEGLAAAIKAETTPEWFAKGVAASGRSFEEMETCVADPATLAAVAKESTDGQASGVNGLPAVFVNGTLLPGNGVEEIGAAVATAQMLGS